MFRYFHTRMLTMTLSIDNTLLVGMVPTELAEKSGLSLYMGEFSYFVKPGHLFCLLPFSETYFRDFCLEDNVSLQLDLVGSSLGDRIAKHCELCTNNNITDDWFCYKTHQEWTNKGRRTSPENCNRLQEHCLECNPEDLEVLAGLELP